jgi:hypothetical protein
MFVYFIQWPIMPVVVTKVRCKAFSEWSNKESDSMILSILACLLPSLVPFGPIVSEE